MKATTEDAERIIEAVGHEPVIEGMDPAEWLRFKLVLFEAKVTDADTHAGRDIKVEVGRLREWCEQGIKLFGVGPPTGLLLLPALEKIVGPLKALLAEVEAVEERLKAKDKDLLQDIGFRDDMVHYAKTPDQLCRVAVAEAAAAYRQLFGRSPSYSTKETATDGGPFGKFLHGCLDAVGVEMTASPHTIRSCLENLPV